MGLSCKAGCSSGTTPARHKETWSIPNNEDHTCVQTSSMTTSRRVCAISSEAEALHTVPKRNQDDTRTSEVDTNTDCGLGQYMNIPDCVESYNPERKVDERTALLQTPHRIASPDKGLDIELQCSRDVVRRSRKWHKVAANTRNAIHILSHPKTWNSRTVWEEVILRPTTLLPAVSLGLLLNMLDAVSYGMILFPSSHSIFSSLGLDGISIFYVSTVVAQVTYSFGGSVFRGGVGSEMIEVVPFFHKMALIILAKVGEENPKSVLATTVLAYALSSIATGVVFFLMGTFKLGTLTAFFPQHVLIGCIGGVGWFLISTAIEVCTGLHSVLAWKHLFQGNVAPLWSTPLGLAVVLILIQRYVKSNFLIGGYFAAVIVLFYLIKVFVGIPMTTLRDHRWVFGITPGNNHAWYHFYTLYDFREVDLAALARTIPTMLALTFFSVLHVPINIPALSSSTGQDDVNVDRELIAHGVSNCLSGLVGSVQNYLVYANSLLFIKSGGSDRLAGLMLAAATSAILFTGLALSIIGYIPVMVVGAMIFLLGIELLSEALISTFGKVHLWEYITIVVVIISMAVWDFTMGIILGIVLAVIHSLFCFCRCSVVQATFSGEEARSTSNRSNCQLARLQEMRCQIRLFKLGGVLFFGTIPAVENHVRSLLDGQSFDSKSQPLRYLILDMADVTRIDFSAAQVFLRLSRILKIRDIQCIVSGLRLDDKVGRVLQKVGVTNCEPDIWVFETMDEALEKCEDRLLTVP